MVMRQGTCALAAPTMLVAALSLAAVPASAQTPFGDPLAIGVIRDFLPPSGFGEKHADAPEEIEQFGELAGVWVAEQEVRRQDGSWMGCWPRFGGVALRAGRLRHARPVVSVGRPTACVSGQPRSGLPALRDPDLLTRSSRWEIAWSANGLGQAPGQDFGTFHATMRDGRLIMTAPGAGANPQRVVFSDFSPSSFLWTSEFSQDGGETWIEVMRVRATRYR
jgi:hypothetical protein